MNDRFFMPSPLGIGSSGESGKATWPIAQPKQHVEKASIIHAVERHRTNEPNEKRRAQNAFASWLTIYNSGMVAPAHYWVYSRSSRDIGDKRELPYLKDVLMGAMNVCPDGGRILLTNDDTILHPTITHRFTTLDKDKPWASRRLNSLGPPNLQWTTERLRASIKPDHGRDLFLMPKQWLRDNWHNIPDFFLGEVEWDLVLTAAIDQMTMKGHIELGYVLHEAHDRGWEKSVTTPASLHNRQISKAWYSTNGLKRLDTL